jgi:hypothetical protein
LRREKLEQLPPREALAKQWMTGSIRPMCLENVLRDIQPDRSNLIHGRLLR